MENKILTDLPRIREKNNKGKIDWDKSVNTYVEINYKDHIYKFKIKKYSRKEQKIIIEYKGSLYSIFTSNFLSCRIGNIVGKVVLKYELNDVYNIFKQNGLELLDNIYKNSITKMKAKTEGGYIVVISLDKLLQGKKPLVFNNKNPYTIENIKLWLKNNNKNYILNTDFFVDQKSHLSLYCINHNVNFKISLDNLLQGKGCRKCGYESFSGNKHYNYNPNLTDEEREKSRYYIAEESYTRWRTDVFKRDNYTCQCCRKIDNINAHHLDGYNWCKEKRTDVDNGVTLCENCHKEFHKLYGYGDNTREQFIDFMKYKCTLNTDRDYKENNKWENQNYKKITL